MTSIYISTTFPSHTRDSLKAVADALSIDVVVLDQAKIIVIPSIEATYIDRKSQAFLQEIAKTLFCEVPIVSHEWLIECGIEFTLLPTDPYDFSLDQDKTIPATLEVDQHPDEKDETASTSSFSDMIHADTSADLLATDSEPDLPLALVNRSRANSPSPLKRVIRDVYDYESSLSPDPETQPKPKKRPFPFQILMQKKKAESRGRRERATITGKDSEAFEIDRAAGRALRARSNRTFRKAVMPCFGQ